MLIEATPPRPLIPRTFRAINGLRGPGALAIAFAHLSLATDLIAYDRMEAVSVFVDMFFVFSGIVIAQAYAERLSRPSAIPEYVLRRFGRIWPVQAATLGILVAYELAKLILTTVFGAHFSVPPFADDGGMRISAIPSNLLLIHALGLHDRETWNFPSWSLSVEFATYLLFALLCLVRPAMRHVLSVLAIFACLGILAFVAPYHMRSTFNFGVFRCAAGFLAGTLCRDIAVRWEIPRSPFPSLIEAGAVGMFILWIVFSLHGYAAYLSPFVISVFLMSFVSERGILSRALCAKPLQILAEASFSIYMVHAVVLIFLLAGLHQYAHLAGERLFVNVANPLAGNPGAPAMVEVLQTQHAVSKLLIGLIYFASVFVASYAAYRWIEVPGRAAFARLAKRISTPSLTQSGFANVAAPSMNPAP